VSQLNEVEQGFYYTFSALTGISILMELGLGVVLMQFASHEFSRLEWTLSGGISGERRAVKRVLGLLRKAIQWYGIMSVMVAIVLIPLGIWIFSRKPESAEVNFLVPWIIFVVGFALGTFLIPLLSVLEGGGRIAEVQKIRFFQTLASPVVIWSLLAANVKLYAAAFDMLVSGAMLAIYIAVVHWDLLLQVFSQQSSDDESISWSRDILPMQWRIAVSWICAYLTSFLLVPLVFEYRGAVEAGQLGISLKFSSMIYLLATAWIATQTPTFGRLIGQARLAEAAECAKLATMRAVFVGAALSIAILIGIESLIMLFPKYASRTLTMWGVGLLCLTSLGAIIVAGIAAYLRSFKEEPLMPTSILIALISAGTVFVCAKWYGTEVMVAALAGAQFLIVVPLHVYVLARKHKERCNLNPSI
jgi:hypothetical protein